eukprot:scaffold118934_cov17-Prasinocladus_malaysianus.AAC.1
MAPQVPCAAIDPAWNGSKCVSDELPTRDVAVITLLYEILGLGGQRAQQKALHTFAMCITPNSVSTQAVHIILLTHANAPYISLKSCSLKFAVAT